VGYGNRECAVRSGVVGSSTAARRHHFLRGLRRRRYWRCETSALGRTLKPLRGQCRQICQRQPSKRLLAPPESFRLQSGLRCCAHGGQPAAVAARHLLPRAEPCRRWGCRVGALLCIEADWFVYLQCSSRKSYTVCRWCRNRSIAAEGLPQSKTVTVVQRTVLSCNANVFDVVLNVQLDCINCSGGHAFRLLVSHVQRFSRLSGPACPATLPLAWSKGLHSGVLTSSKCAGVETAACTAELVSIAFRISDL
jgi:hypothetical protein